MRDDGSLFWLDLFVFHMRGSLWRDLEISFHCRWHVVNVRRWSWMKEMGGSFPGLACLFCLFVAFLLI